MDGISLMPALTGHFTGAQSIAVFRRLAFRRKLCLWVEHRTSDGSPNDELYDLDADDATNLILSPDHKAVRECMSRKLGDALRRHSRWISYWAEFRVEYYSLLPKTSGIWNFHQTRLEQANAVG
jgi:hypothetical protein